MNTKTLRKIREITGQGFDLTFREDGSYSLYDTGQGTQYELKTFKEVLEVLEAVALLSNLT